MTVRVLRGTVSTGVGDFAQWIELLSDHYLRKTGIQLFPGTLNLCLEEPYELPVKCLRLEAEEYGGRVSVSIVPCRVFERLAVILRTDKNDSGHGVHPRRIIEIATDVKLRDAYGLVDGDWVEVEVDEEVEEEKQK